MTVDYLTHTFTGAVIEKGSEPMLIMEYMHHGSLYDILHNETMAIEGELLLPILRDISQGVRFLHSAEPEVVHGGTFNDINLAIKDIQQLRPNVSTKGFRFNGSQNNRNFKFLGNLSQQGNLLIKHKR